MGAGRNTPPNYTASVIGTCQVRNRPNDIGGRLSAGQPPKARASGATNAKRPQEAAMQPLRALSIAEPRLPYPIRFTPAPAPV